MISQIHQRLLSMQDKKYRDFNMAIIKETSYPVIGIRIPELRKLTKELLKQDDVVFKDKYYEEVLVHGLYIAGYKCDFKQKIKMIEQFLPLIDNWGICDSFVTSIKDIRKNKELYYPYVLKYLKSRKQFYQRYSFVVLLAYYIEDEYLDDLYRIIKQQKYNGYYSKMAGAWLLSYLFMKYFDKTLSFIKDNTIDDFVLKKGIQKAKDSYRLTNKQKNILRTLN